MGGPLFEDRAKLPASFGGCAVKAIGTVLLVTALTGLLSGCAQTERDADNIRNLPRQRLGASNGGGEPLTREEALARQKELERERWMNPAPPR
jgi:hypothetical protein